MADLSTKCFLKAWWKVGLIAPKSKTSIYIVGGPTASGKSEFALSLAADTNGCIICADSVQLVRGFKIGAAQPSEQQKKQVPHFLYESLEWNQDYNAGQYRQDALRSVELAQSQGLSPIIVGGTGLYIRALLGEGWAEDLPGDDKLRLHLQQQTSIQLWDKLGSIDPDRQKELHPNDRYRVQRAVELVELTGKTAIQRNLSNSQNSVLNVIKYYFINPARHLLHQRIEKRVHMMLEQGLIEEVQGLLAAGYSKDARCMSSIGYRQVVQHLEGKISIEDLPQQIIYATRQYA
jgi:tRNA dimethylallyltransferase